MKKFHIIQISGSPLERGLSYGNQLSERIAHTYEFYDVLFKSLGLSDGFLRDKAKQLSSLINNYAPHINTELQGVAEGANIDIWKIYAINARTEILNLSIPECTAMYFPATGIMGQTWDFISQLEELSVLVHCTFADGHSYISLTEPGMLAKIGLNSSGIGTCLNFISSKIDTVGVPVHIVLRAVLGCRNFNEAVDVINRSGDGKSSCVMLGTDDGKGQATEFSGKRHATIAPSNGMLVHTNHCVSDKLDSDPIPTSHERLRYAETLGAKSKDKTIDDMANILLSRHDGAEKIQCEYQSSEDLGGLQIGTCATVIMDLSERALRIKKGPGADCNFQDFTL